VEEERLTRRKHSGAFPVQAIRFCLENASLSLSDVDAIAVGYEGGEGTHRDPALSATSFSTALSEMLEAPADISSRLRLIDHHTAHGMSAYWPSGFKDALVVSVDAWGDDASGRVATARDGEFEMLRTFSVEQESLGIFYGMF